ncbi:hypothetical protein [Sphaerisporangium sp. TRM90804]|uniref:hypothetical protein n=1 Tax=Sphaerisporangium sp. TRM90804 TaxID=3031113 RepID=UPI00244B2110|nr:hypothetical protein [Sphaerisporangium sp. TRM90804]MDH2424808.1 hypothetical protein [Sphaerisporangium sp. TRM90804]
MSATADLFKRREDHFRVVVVPNRWGGYDVALVIDGSYANPADARHSADDFKRQIEEALAADGYPYGVPLNSATGRPQVVGTAVEEIA